MRSPGMLVGILTSILVLGASLRASGVEAPALVVVGAGYTGTWDTEILIGNPYDADLNLEVSSVRLSSETTPCTVGTCPPPTPTYLALKANSQITIHVSQMGGLIGGPVIALYINCVPGADSIDTRLPVVRARAYAVATPGRAMELPVVSIAALTSRAPLPFVFVGALHSATAHSNLIVAETSNLVGSDANFVIDAVNSDGEVVASMTRSVSAGGSVFLVDVLGAMGISDFDGVIRVNQTGGPGVVTGALATLTDDGGFAVSGGFNP
jgi:hypothetical protein